MEVQPSLTLEFSKGARGDSPFIVANGTFLTRNIIQILTIKLNNIFTKIEGWQGIDICTFALTL